MKRLPPKFIPATKRRDLLLGQLRKAHQDLLIAADDQEARRKALIAIEEIEDALEGGW